MIDRPHQQQQRQRRSPSDIFPLLLPQDHSCSCYEGFVSVRGLEDCPWLWVRISNLRNQTPKGSAGTAQPPSPQLGAKAPHGAETALNKPRRCNNTDIDPPETANSGHNAVKQSIGADLHQPSTSGRHALGRFERRNLDGAMFECNAELAQLLREYDELLRDRFVAAGSVVEFLIELREVLERVAAGSAVKQVRWNVLIIWITAQRLICKMLKI